MVGTTQPLGTAKGAAALELIHGVVAPLAVQYLPLASIRPPVERPLRPLVVQRLLESMLIIGFTEAILVSPHGEYYLIQDGRQRYEAGLRLGTLSIPCRITLEFQTDSPKDRTLIALVESISHQTLTILELAEALCRLSTALNARGLRYLPGGKTTPSFPDETQHPPLSAIFPVPPRTVSTAGLARLAGVSERTVLRLFTIGRNLQPNVVALLRCHALADHWPVLDTLARLKEPQQTATAYALVSYQETLPQPLSRTEIRRIVDLIHGPDPR